MVFDLNAAVREGKKSMTELKKFSQTASDRDEALPDDGDPLHPRTSPSCC